MSADLSREGIGSNSSSDFRCHAEVDLDWHAAKDRRRNSSRTINVTRSRSDGYKVSQDVPSSFHHYLYAKSC